MSSSGPSGPPERLQPRITTWSRGEIIVRVHSLPFGPAEFNPGKGHGGRFDPLHDPLGRPVPTLYGASDFTAALAETVFREAADSGAAGGFLLRPGMVFLWAGAIGTIPSGWQLCDGSGPTVDLRGYFVELASTGQAGQAAGNDTVAWTGTSGPGGFTHDHRGSTFPTGSNNEKLNINQHGLVSGNNHSHSLAGSQAYTPPYYALAFIMYTGS